MVYFSADMGPLPNCVTLAKGQCHTCFPFRHFARNFRSKVASLDKTMIIVF